MRTEKGEFIMSEFKPCPFCGNSVTLGFMSPHPYAIYVQCGKCGGESGAAKSEVTALEKWNKRTFGT